MDDGSGTASAGRVRYGGILAVGSGGDHMHRVRRASGIRQAVCASNIGHPCVQPRARPVCRPRQFRRPYRKPTFPYFVLTGGRGSPAMGPVPGRARTSRQPLWSPAYQARSAQYGHVADPSPSSGPSVLHGTSFPRKGVHSSGLRTFRPTSVLGVTRCETSAQSHKFFGCVPAGPGWRLRPLASGAAGRGDCVPAHSGPRRPARPGRCPRSHGPTRGVAGH